ncbi:SseB family protein [Weissella confusa]|nr:SseB family protein [Weissella confusa]MBD5833707.1 hypothetical protein [Weissella confusa]MBJ7641980.1 hypothetical protein [Weissella confusa]MBJ7656454.1 hypothetical protein [Weissella confusa]MBJ7659585.1 hypothetical protein [Weissella confusa]TGE41086.1 hypothetical protein C6P25_09105 [Weissella confusa]
MERVFLNINQTNRELNRKIKQYLKQQTVRGQVRDLRVLARALTDVTLLVPVTVSDSDRRTSSSGYTYVIGTPDVQRQQGYTVRDDGRYLVLYTDLAKSRAGHREPNTMQVQMPFVLQKLGNAKNLAGIILNPGTDDVVLPKALLAEELDGSDTGAVTGTVADDLPIQAPEQVAPPIGVVAVGLRLNELSRLNEELETFRSKTERRIDRYARQTWNFVAVVVLVTLALLAVPALGRRGLLPTVILIVLALIVGRIIPVSATTRQKAKTRVYEKERALVRMIALEDEIARLSFNTDDNQQLDDAADYGTDDLDYINQDVRNTNLVRLLGYFSAATEPDEKEYLLGEIDKQLKKALFVQPIFSEGHVIERDVLGRPYLADDEPWINEFIGDGEGNLYLHLYLKTRDAIKADREILTIRRADWISYMMNVNPQLVGVAFEIPGETVVFDREDLSQLHYEPNYNRKVPTSYFMPGDLDAVKKPEQKPQPKAGWFANVARSDIDWSGYALAMLIAYAIGWWLMYSNKFQDGLKVVMVALGLGLVFFLFTLDINRYRKKYNITDRIAQKNDGWRHMLGWFTGAIYIAPIAYVWQPTFDMLQIYMVLLGSSAFMAAILIVVGLSEAQNNNK